VSVPTNPVNGDFRKFRGAQGEQKDGQSVQHIKYARKS
jgi:hypothetical protein